MIRYDLECRKKHRFEGWFASSSAYEDEAAKGRVACPVCNSKKIAKAPMAPSVATRSAAAHVLTKELAMRARRVASAKTDALKLNRVQLGQQVDRRADVRHQFLPQGYAHG